MPEIETAQPEIETELTDIENVAEDDLQQAVSVSSRAVSISGRAVYFRQVEKIFPGGQKNVRPVVALNVQLALIYHCLLVDICSLVQKIKSLFQAGRKNNKSGAERCVKAAAARDLEPRSMLCLGTFRKKVKVARH